MLSMVFPECAFGGEQVWQTTQSTHKESVLQYLTKHFFYLWTLLNTLHKSHMMKHSEVAIIGKDLKKPTPAVIGQTLDTVHCGQAASLSQG